VVEINSTKEVKSMAVYCFTQPIQPGKRDDARAIFEEIRTSRREEYEASRKRLGIREERVWFQSLPDGELAVVYWEGDDPRGALERFASSDDPFDAWLKERGREVYHFEPLRTLEEDEEVFTYSAGPVSGVTDTVRGATDKLLGGEEKQR
jgi:LmbE family N-acetylglucosaminyl deacetylase